MSLLPCTSHANPTTPFWSTTGGGGGGGVTSIIAGSGIAVDTNTGDVTVSNTTPAVNTTLGNIISGSNTTGINSGDKWTIGTVKRPNFYTVDDNYYIAGITVVISQIISTSLTYDGNVWITLEYDDGTTVYQGRQVVNINYLFNNNYSASVVIGFKNTPVGTLTINVVNQEGNKINSLDYEITDFYCVDNGPIGSFLSIF